MKNKNLKKRISAAILAIILAFSISSPIFAASNQGSEETALKKAYFYAAKFCLGKTKKKIDGSDINSGYPDIKWGSEGGLFAGATVNSAFIQYDIMNTVNEGAGWFKGHDLGEVRCSNQGFWDAVYNRLGISYNELICGSGGLPGIMETGRADQPCGSSQAEHSRVGNWEKNFENLVINKTFGGNPPGGIKALTDVENYYLRWDVFSAVCADTSAPTDNPDALYKNIAHVNNGSIEYVNYLSSYAEPNKKINLIDKYGGGEVTETCPEIASSLQKNSSYVKALQNTGNIASAEHDSSDNTYATENGVVSVESSCGNSSALGWLLCPLLEGIASFTVDLYNQYIEPSLMMQSELVSGSGTRSAWESFRNIANIALVIVVIVVVISQVTGFGIDNYGIKKTLPKIIVCAILINLSFIVCQLAVDVSNIVGVGIQKLFDNIAVDASSGLASSGSGGFWFSSISLLAGFAGAAIVVTHIGSLLALLGGLISATIGVLTMFLLLSVRKAGVIILIAAAPIAFAMMLLPNTKKIFDKWLKAFEGLLFLFPLCGLVMGGGGLASRIILGNSTDNLGLAITAMIVAIAPVFLIPSLVRGSFAAMGNIGNKISGFGQRFGRGASRSATGAIGRTNAYKQIEKRQSENRADRAINRINRAQNRIDRRNARRGLSEGDRGYRTLAAWRMAQKADAEKAKLGLEEERDTNRKMANEDYVRNLRAQKMLASAQDEENAEALVNEFNTNPDLAGVDLSHIDGRALKGTNYAKGLAGQAQFMAGERIKGTTQFAQDYRVDRNGNTLVRNASGGWSGIDKNGKKLNYTADEAKDFKTISYAQAKSQGMDVMRAGDYGRTAGYARSDVANYASRASALTGLNQSTDMAKNTIIEGADSVLKLRHDKGEDARNATIGLAKEGTHVTSIADYQKIAQTRERAFETKNFEEKLQSLSIPDVETEFKTVMTDPTKVHLRATAANTLWNKGGKEKVLNILDVDTTPASYDKVAYYGSLESSLAQQYSKHVASQLDAGVATNSIADFKTFCNTLGTGGLKERLDSKIELARKMSDDDIKHINTINPAAISDAFAASGLMNLDTKAQNMYINNIKARYAGDTGMDQFLLNSGMSFDQIFKLDKNVLDKIFTPTFVPANLGSSTSFVSKLKKAASTNPNLKSKIPPNIQVMLGI